MTRPPKPSKDRKIIHVLFWVIVLAALFLAGIALGASSSTTQRWVYALAGALITSLACVKFVAISILSFRTRQRVSGVLMGMLAMVFGLMTLACWGHLLDILQASR